MFALLHFSALTEFKIIAYDQFKEPLELHEFRKMNIVFIFPHFHFTCCINLAHCVDSTLDCVDLTYNWSLRNELETSAPGVPAANHVLCLHCRQQWDEFHVFDREVDGYARAVQSW